MTPREQGFLLLTSQLGNPDRKSLTAAQLRTLTGSVRDAQVPLEDRDLEARDLMALGYGQEMACRIVGLLEERELLEHYLLRAKRAGCIPVTRVSPGYPVILRKRLGAEAPGCLWAKGDLSLLEMQAVSLVGSRDLRAENRLFAREVGRQAARQGFVLISGNARGADREAQNACLEAGGSVISVVADELEKQKPGDRTLYLSEDSFDLAFSTPRALSRNRCIHAMGCWVMVAQASLQSGGTWHGTSRNLRFGWSSVFCFDDGSDAARVLEQMGALQIDAAQLLDFGALPKGNPNLFDI